MNFHLPSIPSPQYLMTAPLPSDYRSNSVPLSQLPKQSQIFAIYALTLLMYIVASPDPNHRGGSQLPNPNECNSMLTSATRGEMSTSNPNEFSFTQTRVMLGYLYYILYIYEQSPFTTGFLAQTCYIYISYKNSEESKQDCSNIYLKEDKNNNVFREILKCFRKTAKFEFFAKQIIYLASPDHPLQNDT